MLGNLIIEKYKDYYLMYEFLQEIEKYYDVIQITENIYLIAELEIEIEIMD